MERKSEWFSGVKFFRSIFKVVRKRCLNKNALSHWCFFVHMRQFHFNFYRFFDFWIGFFFLNGFHNPFIVHPRPRASGFFLTEKLFFFLRNYSPKRTLWQGVMKLMEKLSGAAFLFNNLPALLSSLLLRS